MSAARRARLFARDEGRCHLCGQKVLAGEAYDLDHIIPWALSFNDADDNLKVAHKTCHRNDKTCDDVKRIAKAKRQSGIESGQAAKRAKRGYSLIQGRGFEKPKEKKPWPKRSFNKWEKT